MAMTEKRDGVVDDDYTPEKMVVLLEEMKQRGRAVTIPESGELLDCDAAIKFYRRRCAIPQTLRA